MKQFAWLLALLLPLAPAFAQGCAMCKTSAEAAGSEQQKALNRGIVVLAVPSVLIFGGLAVFAVRYRSAPRTNLRGSEKGQDTGLL